MSRRVTVAKPMLPERGTLHLGDPEPRPDPGAKPHEPCTTVTGIVACAVRPELSVTWTCTAHVPCANANAGPHGTVPLSVPSAPSNSPGGGAPLLIDHVYGPKPPDAASVCE